MIYNWRYETGDWDLEFREPSAWRCKVYKDDGLEVHKWILEQGYVEEIDFEIDLKWNSGSPAYFISLYNKSLATEFVLRWKLNES